MRKFIAVLLFAGLIGFVGCEKSTGDKVDDKIDEGTDKVEDAKDAASDSADDAADKLKKIGE